MVRVYTKDVGEVKDVKAKGEDVSWNLECGNERYIKEELKIK